MTEGYTLSDISAVTGGNRSNGGGFGGEDGWWLIILFLLFGGYGRGGYGFGGGATGGGDCATKADISGGFAMNNLQSGITAIQQGICDATYALSNTINGGFNGVERGFCNLSSQLADCCCQTQRAIDGINYNMAKNTCDLQNTVNTNTRDLLDNQNSNTRAILDFLTQSKIDALRDENQELRRAASQDRQNAYFTTALQAQTAQIVDRVAPYPVPAYPVPAPYPYGYSQNCGCGCGAGFGATA